MERIRLAVLVSGRGSNLQSLIDACGDENFPAQVALVISNKPDAYALQRAAQANIRNLTVDHKNFDSKEKFEQAVQDELDKEKIELVCLAGFMRILSASFVEKWHNRIINIHPSLLPNHKGLDTHARAIAAGDRMSGCTVHYVTAGMDEGEAIVQKSLAVFESDTPETLATRILELEHQAYPEAVRLVAGRLKAS